jgi:nucleotide-binding universal stress UspA family protein
MLVPLDGSERAERALPVAARLAQSLQSTLILLRVVQPPLQVATPLAPPLRVETEILSEHVDAANAYLTRIAQELDAMGVKYEKVTVVGYPAEMTLEAAHASRADVIILCSHGRTGLMRWALGSVAQRVVHQASVPVLVLPSQGQTLAEDAQRPLRVLVPLDGSWLAEAALGPAVMLVGALAPKGQGTVHLAQVVRHLPPVVSEEGQPPSAEAKSKGAGFLEAEDYLSRTAEQLNAGPLVQFQVKVTWSVVVDKDVAGAVVDLAQSGKTAQGVDQVDRFDVIAMATHGRGGLHRWVMGSNTERVLSAARLPMLVIRPKEIVVTSRFNANPSENEFTLQAQKG